MKKFKKIFMVSVTTILIVGMVSVCNVFATDDQQPTLTNDQQTTLTDDQQPTLVDDPSGCIQLGAMPIVYTVVDVSEGDPVWDCIATTEGVPNVNIGISKSKSVSITYSGTFGATEKQLTAAVGFTYGGSVTVSIEGHYTVPKHYDGHKVKSATLYAYVKERVKHYTVRMRHSDGSITSSRGTSKKAENNLKYEVKIYFTNGHSETLTV